MGSGFAVLPDTAAAAALRAVFPAAPTQVFTHASGRPWLLGLWSSDPVLVVTVGAQRVGVVGTCPITPARLRELAARVRSASDVDGLAARLPGSCHLVVSAPRWMRVQGSATGLHRVFHTRVGGVDVAADRADVLAAMTGSGVDEAELAMRVVCGTTLPPPANDTSTWSGVDPLAPDECLVWDADRARRVRWWRPPAPHLDLARGAIAVRDALTTVMRNRHPDGGRLSADLSGGMDSTSLCFLAARGTPGLVTMRWGETDSGNDDTVFAAHAVELLDRSEHHVVSPAGQPRIFDEPAAPTGTDEPYAFSRTAARTRHNAALLAGLGSRWHLAGHGGDELFTPGPAYLHELMRRRPWSALGHLRGYVALKRWPLLPTLAALLRPGTPATWWRAQAEHVHAPRPHGRAPILGWGSWPLHAPPWITPDGIDVARERLRCLAERAQPLSDDIGQHHALLVLRSNAPRYRLVARLFAEAGVRLDMPYFDDRVAEAVLAVRSCEHAGTLRYKPLLADAMRGIVPGMVLSRATKGEFGADVRTGLRRNLPAILDLFADSALAARGLIDPDELRIRLLGPQRDNTAILALESLIGCETWLRAALNYPAQTARRPDEPAATS